MIRWVQTVIFICAALIVLSSVICSIMSIKPVIVMSGSMEPVIKTGSVLFINEKDRDVVAGDIIAFKRRGMLVAHRVEKIFAEKIITKGDNNENVDAGYIKQADITGTAVLCIPAAGYVMNWLRSPGGIIFVLLFIVVIVAANHFIGKGYEDEQKEGSQIQ